jgi:hypothetical protein
MNLLTGKKEIEKEFIRLMRDYQNYYWVSAWAGIDSTCFYDLMKNQEKIGRIIIGTFFDQTHPDFIEEFSGNRNVKFVMQEKGVGTFHPKVYLFQNNKNEWELLVGSMNFTSAGFNTNTEALLLVSSAECENSVYEKTFNLINKSWENGRYISDDELAKYREVWKNQRKWLGQYGNNKPGKPIGRVEIMNLTWSEFVKRVKTEDAHNLEGRVAVLDAVESLFNQYDHFHLMTKKERKAVAGFLEEKKGIDWLWFGSMKGSGKFKSKINANDDHISQALDKIPLTGQIKRKHYDEFIEEYKKAFPTGNWIATSSRLLAMKRPDVFVCFDSKNQKKLCKEFGIKQSNMTYERYWDEIICRILDSEWWKSPMPDNDESRIWKRRSAFLDAFYYVE